MTPQELIWLALGKPEPQKMKKQAKESWCALCGMQKGTIRKGDILGSGFTNWDKTRRPESESVCVHCWACLRSEHARQLRSSNWIATPGGMQFFKRNEIASHLFGSKEIPFCFYVTTSFKKLGTVKVELQTNPGKFLVQFEEIPVFFDAADHKPIFDIITLFYSIPKEEEQKKQPKSFFTKAEIETGNYKPHRIREFGIEDWHEFENVLQKWRGSSVFPLLIFAANQVTFGREKVRKDEKNAPKEKNKLPVTRRDGDGKPDGDGRERKQEQEKSKPKRKRKQIDKAPGSAKPDLPCVEVNQLGFDWAE